MIMMEGRDLVSYRYVLCHTSVSHLHLGSSRDLHRHCKVGRKPTRCRLRLGSCHLNQALAHLMNCCIRERTMSCRYKGEFLENDMIVYRVGETCFVERDVGMR